MARLGDLCTIQSGGTPSRHNKDYWEKGRIPWVKISDIKGKCLDITEEYISELGLENSSAKIFPAGTILYTIFATLGEVCVLNIDAATNQAIAGIQLKDGRVDKDYLYYYLFSRKATVNNIGRGVAQNNINMTILRDFEVPLPTPDEQRKIAAVLDKVSDLIAKRRQQLDKLDEMVKARFVEMFGDPIGNPYHWNIKRLFQLGDCKNGMNFRLTDIGVNIHCLGVGDFKNLSCISDTSKLSTISLTDMPSDEYMLKDGDIVFVRSNGNKALVGRSLVVYPATIPTTFSGFCIRFRLHTDEVKANYLLRVLKNDSIRKKMAGRGANIQNLNQKILGELQIPVPPLELQNQFTVFVEQTDKTRTIINHSLEKLEILKKALMQKYFNKEGGAIVL